jgi:BirA family biotin operon repressor/biotin-[acetyl-CoA-carboxylase] ligase
MKGCLLQILRSEGGVVSGEVLSTELGISRVSVWKHIHKLKDYGYPIHSTPKGYQLTGDPDVLYPWEFPTWESKIHYFSEVSSTMVSNVGIENPLFFRSELHDGHCQANGP